MSMWCMFSKIMESLSDSVRYQGPRQLTHTRRLRVRFLAGADIFLFTASRPTYEWLAGSLSPGCERDHSHPSSAEI